VRILAEQGAQREQGGKKKDEPSGFHR
jgi:hypothetical protein